MLYAHIELEDTDDHPYLILEPENLLWIPTALKPEIDLDSSQWAAQQAVVNDAPKM